MVLAFSLSVYFTLTSAGATFAAPLCGDGSAPDYGFTYDLQQAHWTVDWQDYASEKAMTDVDAFLDRLNGDSIAQTMILIKSQDQVGNRVNCAVHFLRYMRLGQPAGERKDNGFVFLIVVEPTRIDVHNGVVEVKATNGDTHLGGDDLDAVLTEYIVDEFKKVQGIDLRKDRQALQRLTEAAEKAKIELSSILETEVNLPFITANASGPQHLQIKITRARLEQISEPLVQRCRGPFEAALLDARRTPQDLDELVLIGGATRKVTNFM
jgi:hypothetical protein